MGALKTCDDNTNRVEAYERNLHPGYHLKRIACNDDFLRYIDRLCSSNPKRSGAACRLCIQGVKMYCQTDRAKKDMPNHKDELLQGSWQEDAKEQFLEIV